ncbi:response regulator transcription factor [Amycolatopsis anabasis]|uniref:response regulator transcription factor n=1 Tax=Amycolatopsis anabasis TaxID=1840409 RepID=UPI0015D44CEB|nr:response regulator transcription factor [Amycolatopsis anabasis]
MTTSRPERVLVVEDDNDLRASVCAELGAAGYQVAAAADLAAADAILRRGDPDCVVLDRMLPDGDALHYVRARRRDGWPVRVLFLTARDTGGDIFDGFAVGADDYLVKPFPMAVLTARVRRLTRSGPGRPPILRYADLEIDCARRETRRAGALLMLSHREFAVLEYLAVRPDRVITRTELIEHCWDEDADPMSNVVDAVIVRLRRKLGAPNLIHAVRGRGYLLGGEGS